MIEESNPLNMTTLTKAKEQIWDDTNTSNLHDLSTADRFYHNNQFVWRFRIERDFNLTLSLSSWVRNNENILQFCA